MNKFVIVIGLMICLSVSCAFANENVDRFVPSSGLKIENFCKNNQVKNNT